MLASPCLSCYVCGQMAASSVWVMILKIMSNKRAWREKSLHQSHPPPGRGTDNDLPHLPVAPGAFFNRALLSIAATSLESTGWKGLQEKIGFIWFAHQKCGTK